MHGWKTALIKAVTINRYIGFIRYSLISYLELFNQAYRYTYWTCLFHYNIIISPLQGTKTHGEQLANGKNDSNGLWVSRDDMNFDWLYGKSGLDKTCVIAPMRKAVLSFMVFA